MNAQQVCEADIPKLHVFIHDHCAFIVLLSIPSHMRGKGYATSLLFEVSKHCRRMELDDMTSRCRQQGNVYTRLGFVYTGEHGPEMSCTSRLVSRRATSLLPLL